MPKEKDPKNGKDEKGGEKEDPLKDRMDHVKKQGVVQLFIIKEKASITDNEIAASMISNRDDIRKSTHRPERGLLKFNIMQSIPASLLDERILTNDQWVSIRDSDPDWAEIEDKG